MCWNAPYLWVKLRISLVNRRKTLHASLYSYKLEFVPSGMSVLISSVEDTLRGSTFLMTRNGQKWLIWKSTQVHSMLVLGSPGTLLSYIERSLMVLADFHDMLEILIFRTIIVVCHVKAIITVNLNAAL